MNLSRNPKCKKMNNDENQQDIGSLKAAILKNQKENQKLEENIKNCIKENNELEFIRKQILFVQQQLREEEKSNTKETISIQKRIAKLKKKIESYEKVDMKMEISLNTVKLTTLQVSLKSNTEKLYRVDQKYAELKEQTRDYSTFDKDIDLKIAEQEKICYKMDIISKNLGAFAPLIMNIIDLEGRFKMLDEHVRGTLESISIKSIELQELKTKRSVQMQHLEDIYSDDSLDEVIPGLYSIKVSELSNLIASMQDVNNDQANQNKVLSEIKNQTNQDLKAFEIMKNDYEKKKNNIDSQIKSINTESKRYSEEAKTRMIKMKQLSKELKQKINEQKTQILRKRSEDPDLSNLTSVLENKWREHQQALDKYQKGKQKLEKKRVILDNKLKVIEDLNELCPLKSKVKTTPGTEEFMFLYDVVYTQNRDMGNDLNLLSKEENKLLTENDKLKKELKLL